ncbi:MAG: IPT/TIG domain-containing protein [Blastocatellia bacterium]
MSKAIPQKLFLRGLALLLFCFSAVCVQAQTPRDFVSVDAARYAPVVAPNSIAAGFTVAVTSGSASATDVDAETPGIQLPTRLAGLSVSVNNRLAGLLVVTPNQINYIVPPETETDGPATVTVTNATGAVLAQGILNVARSMLSVFTANQSGAGAPAALYTADGVSYSAVGRADGTSNVVPAGQFLVLFGTGIRGAQQDVKAFIGGVEAPIVYAGAQGEFLALYQVNIQIPESLANQGQVQAYLQEGTTVSNTVTIDLGGNTTAPAGAPIVSAISVTEAAAGQVVKLTGSQFATNPGQASVRFGGVTGQVISTSAAEMSFVVPYGATTGRLIVGNAAGERLTTAELRITTSISGTVLGMDGNPVSGLPVTVSEAGVSTNTDATGRFLLAGVRTGINRLDFDATGTSNSSDSYSLVVTGGRDNELGFPVVLFQDFGTGLSLAADRGLSGTEEAAPAKVITHEGVTLTIPGKITFPGNVEQGRLKLTRLPNTARLPFVPAGVFPSAVALITPPGVTFGEADGTGKASLSFPNVDRAAAGTKLDLYAYDRKVTPSGFVKKGEATVNAAGDKVVADGLIDIATVWFVAPPVDNSMLTKATGRVTDADGKPVNGAFVFARNRVTRTDREGKFVIEGIRAKNGDELNVQAHFQTPAGFPLKAEKTVPAVVPGETSVGDIKLPAQPALLLMIRPGEVKVNTGDTVRMNVVLSKPLSAESTIRLAKVEGVNVTIQPLELKVPAGKTEAEFSVTGGAAGRAVIGAALAAVVDNITPEQVRPGRAMIIVPGSAPVLTGIDPAMGAPGSAFTVSGTGFGAEAKNHQLMFQQGDRLIPVDPAKVGVVSSPNGVLGLKGVVPGLKAGDAQVFVVRLQEGTMSLPSNKLSFKITEAAAPVLQTISPVDALPGAEFTLTGTGIHPDARRNGVMFRVGDRIIPADPSMFKVLTTTSAGSAPPVVTGLVGRVPNAPAGAAEVFLVVFYDNAVSAASNKLAFTFRALPGPTLTTIDPVEGRAGTPFVIRGAGFVPDRTFVFFVQGERKVLLDGATTGIGVDAIRGVVPNVTAGDYEIQAVVTRDTTTAGVVSNRLKFRVLSPATTLPAPKLVSLSPVEGQPGTPVTVAGSGFGAQNAVFIVQGERRLGIEPANVRTGVDSVSFVLPAVSTGDYSIVVVAIKDGVRSEPSNGLAFKALAPPPPAAPKLGQLTPAEGAPGAQFQLSGTGFSTDPGANVITFRQGDRKIRVEMKPVAGGLAGVVPAVPAGVYEVVAVVLGIGVSSPESNVLTFKMLASPAPAAPVLTAIGPANGASPGQRFLLTGTGFGPFLEVYFKLGATIVRVDPATFSTTAEGGVSGVVPNLPAGDVEVWVTVGAEGARSPKSNHLKFRVNARI